MAAKLKDRNVILVCEGIAYKLSSPDGVCTEKRTFELLPGIIRFKSDFVLPVWEAGGIPLCASQKP